MKTTLLVMVLNEIQGVQEIMPRISREWVSQILIVDGGSTDGTVQWCEDHGYEVVKQETTGVRQGYIEAWPLCEGEMIITFSPDGNSIPELIPKLVKGLEQGYDMVIASRYLDDAKSFDDTLLSGLANWFFTKSINILHGGSYSDAMGIYRGYSKALVHGLDLSNEVWFRPLERIFGTRGVSWEPLLSCRAARRRLSVLEIPGDEPERIDGVSRVMPDFSTRIRWAAVLYCQILRTLWWR